MSNYIRPESIAIDARKGTKVNPIFENGEIVNGTDNDKKWAMKHLLPDKIYTIDKTDIGGWRTNVFLEEFPNIAFNSVHFTYAEPITVPKNNMLHWEEIKHDHDFYLIRTKVPGGWLILAEFDALTPSRADDRGHQFRPSMTFVPDPNHEWKIDG